MKNKNTVIRRNISTLILLVLSMQFVTIANNSVIAAQLEANSEWFEVAQNTYVFRYNFHYTLFVKTSKGVIAFDPLSNEAAEHYVKAIKLAAPDVPLRAIVYSHWHTDHSTGASVLQHEFGKSVPIIAHDELICG